MAGRDKHLLNRDGRYFARLVVPKDLRPYMNGKTELRTPLGPDYRSAARKLPVAVAALMHDVARAERRAAAAVGKRVVVGRYPLSAEELAHSHYQGRLVFDEELRNANASYASMEVDSDLGREYRDGFSGKLNDDRLEELVGRQIERFRLLGNTEVTKGSDDWRALARALCISEYEALCRVDERNEGNFAGAPQHPMLAKAVEPPAPKTPAKITGLLDDYLREREADGKGREARRRWTPVFADLAKFVGHNDARRLTKQNVLDWKDARLKTLAAKTVSHVHLSALRTVLSWAVNNDLLELNVAEKVRVLVSRKARTRERGFTLSEAVIVLQAARDYVPANSDNPQTRERAETTAAKKWSPLLCAFTGARIAEITQLRKEDIRFEGPTPVVRITPEAGSVKSNEFRDVPLHRQLVETGFLDFVTQAPDGPLFYPGSKKKDGALPARTVAGRVSQWLQKIGVVPAGVSPTHGWRHRFKTVGRELGIADRILDAIQGHAARTAGDEYGDVTIAARRSAIDRFPSFELN